MFRTNILLPFTTAFLDLGWQNLSHNLLSRRCICHPLAGCVLFFLFIFILFFFGADWTLPAELLWGVRL